MKENTADLKNSEDKERDLKVRSFYDLGKKNLYKGNIIEAYKNFSIIKNVLGCAYCKFLFGDINQAYDLLNMEKGLNPAINWLLSLISILNGDKVNRPAYFQIRNFYESTMNLLFLYKNYDFINRICLNLEYLSYYNQEVYKFTGRVFLDNLEINNAIIFLKKSINIFYNDPEVHFMLGEAYLSLGENERAKKEYIKSYKIGPQYYPAKEKLKQISNCI